MTVKTFESIDAFKAAAEFFPAGKIVPRRILKAPRRISSWVRFGSDTWALSTPKGYLCAVDCGETGSAIRLVFNPRNPGIAHATIKGSPYTPNGVTSWQGNKGSDESAWLDDLNRCLVTGCAQSAAQPRATATDTH